MHPMAKPLTQPRRKRSGSSTQDQCSTVTTTSEPHSGGGLATSYSLTVHRLMLWGSQIAACLAAAQNAWKRGHLFKHCVFPSKVSTRVLLARPLATMAQRRQALGCHVRPPVFARRLADSEFIARGARRTGLGGFGHFTVHIIRLVCLVTNAFLKWDRRNLPHLNSIYILASMPILLQTTCWMWFLLLRRRPRCISPPRNPQKDARNTCRRRPRK